MKIYLFKFIRKILLKNFTKINFTKINFIKINFKNLNII